MMLWKCCTHYASKFGKFTVITALEKVSFIPMPKAIPKNVQISIQLPSFHMLARLCSKSFKLGFSSTWTENFQMFKLDFEKAEEPDIKLPISVTSSKKQESSRTTSTSISVTMPKSLCGYNKLWKILKDMGIPDHLTCLLRNLYAHQEAIVRTGHKTRLVSNRERSTSRLYIVTLLI